MVCIFIFWVCRVLLGLLPLILHLRYKSKSHCLCLGLFFFLHWQRGTLSDFGVPFRGLSRKDNRHSGRIGTTNTNGLQELLCSMQSTHAHTHTPYIVKTLPLSLLAQAKDQRAFCIGKMLLSFCNTTTTDSHSVASGQWMSFIKHVHSQLSFSQICVRSL